MFRPARPPGLAPSLSPTKRRCRPDGSASNGAAAHLDLPPPAALAHPQFLRSQLPARLENHVSRLQALLPEAASPALAGLISESAAAKALVLDCARDWELLGLSDVPALRHFDSHLAGFKERVEAEMARLMAGAQQLTQAPGWWQQERSVHALNAALDLTHWWAAAAGRGAAGLLLEGRGLRGLLSGCDVQRMLVARSGNGIAFKAAGMPLAPYTHLSQHLPAPRPPPAGTCWACG